MEEDRQKETRSAQINRGVAEATSPSVVVLHADTLPPDDAITVVRDTLADPRIALAGFVPLIGGEHYAARDQVSDWMRCKD